MPNNNGVSPRWQEYSLELNVPETEKEVFEVLQGACATGKYTHL
jgi:hypothetical protein